MIQCPSCDRVIQTNKCACGWVSPPKTQRTAQREQENETYDVPPLSIDNPEDLDQVRTMRKVSPSLYDLFLKAHPEWRGVLESEGENHAK